MSPDILSTMFPAVQGLLTTPPLARDASPPLRPCNFGLTTCAMPEPPHPASIRLYASLQRDEVVAPRGDDHAWASWANAPQPPANHDATP